MTGPLNPACLGLLGGEVFTNMAVRPALHQPLANWLPRWLLPRMLLRAN